MSSLFDLTGRVALVTGSSRGIGNALARALARVRQVISADIFFGRTDRWSKPKMGRSCWE